MRQPRRCFYDWLYITALHECAGFTDINFNPERSINC